MANRRGEEGRRDLIGAVAPMGMGGNLFIRTSKMRLKSDREIKIYD
jgi:hypothetical protein